MPQTRRGATTPPHRHAPQEAEDDPVAAASLRKQLQPSVVKSIVGSLGKLVSPRQSLGTKARVSNALPGYGR